MISGRLKNNCNKDPKPNKRNITNLFKKNKKECRSLLKISPNNKKDLTENKLI